MKKKNVILIALFVILVLGITLTTIVVLPKNKKDDTPSDKTSEKADEAQQDLPELIENKSEKSYLTFDLKGDYYYKESYQSTVDLISLVYSANKKFDFDKTDIYLSTVFNKEKNYIIETYSIGNIKTNLNYRFTIKDDKLSKLEVIGVKKKNLKRVNKTDEEKLKKLADNFNIEEFLKSKNIDREKNPPLEEEFYYDYNTQELIYEYGRLVGEERIYKRIN